MHEATEGLCAVQRQLAQLTDRSAACAAMFDRDMRCLARSRSWVTHCRIDREQALGRSHYETFPEIPERWKEIHRRALAGESCRSELDLWVRPTGESQWVRWSVDPWYDESSAIGGILLTVDDITLQRTLKHSLENTAATLDALFERVSVGIAIADSDGRFLRTNPAYRALTGYSEEELRSMFIGSLLSPDDAEPVITAIEELRSGHAPMSQARCRLCRKGGASVEVDHVVSTIPGGAGGPMRLAVFAHDGTERATMERKLRQNDRLASIGMLGAGLGHDMGNVLFALRGALAGLRAAGARADVSAVGEASLGTMAEGIGYLQRLSEALHELAVPPVGESATGAPGDAPAPALEFGPWWERMSVLFERTLPRGVELRVSVEPGLPPVRMASAALTQVLLNLLVNAGHALASRPVADARAKAIHVRAFGEADGAFVRIAVQDDGVGMDAATLRRAFEPFFTTRGESDGTGLGLALVQRLVDAAGGSVRVESTHGVGTEVTVRLPAERRSARGGGTASREPVPSAATPDRAAARRRQAD